ncbi:MAG: DNA alkylation repair protein, partial [candidate division Zixibacteria bacterium]|nr:DNA alkylation repair protein [candidate division Zixibacteria bacterium]
GKMTLKQVLAELKNMGTAQNVKVYKRHGAGDNLYGVSFANLGTLKKKIKVDHELALQLWDTGNADAQTLAMMIVDPEQLTASQINQWVAGINYYVLSDMLSGVVARTPFAQKKIEQWMAAKTEFMCATGYSGLASALKDNLADITDADCKRYLRTIVKDIHKAPNRARHAMNGAVIAIGVFRPHLAAEAIAAAKQIGQVAVDHGETNCRTPDAVPYIQKALKRKPRRARVKC